MNCLPLTLTFIATLTLHRKWKFHIQARNFDQLIRLDLCLFERCVSHFEHNTTLVLLICFSHICFLFWLRKAWKILNTFEAEHLEELDLCQAVLRAFDMGGWRGPFRCHEVFLWFGWFQFYSYFLASFHHCMTNVSKSAPVQLQATDTQLHRWGAAQMSFDVWSFGEPLSQSIWSWMVLLMAHQGYRVKWPIDYAIDIQKKFSSYSSPRVSLTRMTRVLQF